MLLNIISRSPPNSMWERMHSVMKSSWLNDAWLRWIFNHRSSKAVTLAKDYAWKLIMQKLAGDRLLESLRVVSLGSPSNARIYWLFWGLAYDVPSQVILSKEKWLHSNLCLFDWHVFEVVFIHDFDGRLMCRKTYRTLLKITHQEIGV